MHRQFSALLSAGGSPGKLAQLGQAFGQAGINIDLIGGAEWRHFGPVTFVVSDDKGVDPADQIAAVAEVLAAEQFGWIVLRTVEVEIDDTPGQLGQACDILGQAEINIFNIAVYPKHGNRAVVGLGVRPSRALEAIGLLRDAGLTARHRPHPDDPDGDGDPPPWWDHWDDRTEKILDELWDNPDVEMADPRFWQPEFAED